MAGSAIRRRHGVIVSLVLGLAMAALPGVLRAQAVPTISLKPPTVTLAEEFTVIGSVRELSDGRLLVTDERENRIVVADLRRQSVNTLGRTGSGPNEFRAVGLLWPMAGDSTLMVDRGNGRWLILAGARIVGSVASGTPAVKASGVQRLFGADHQGQVLAAPVPTTMSANPDSLAIVAVQRTSGATRVVSRMQPMGMEIVRAMSPGSTQPIGVVSLRPRDQPLLFPDGWVAIARADSYRVDWCPPNQPCVAGPPIRRASTDPDDAFKRGFVALVTARGGLSRPYAPVGEIAGWPTPVPPFAELPGRRESSPLLPLPDGRLLVERLPEGDRAETRYDLIDRKGIRVGELVVERNQRVLGFGAASIYVAETDADGLQRLSQHPWP